MSITVYKFDKSAVDTYADFNTFIAALGATECSVIIAEDAVLTNDLIVPATCDIAAFWNNAEISGAYSITINKMSATLHGGEFNAATTVVFNAASNDILVPADQAIYFCKTGRDKTSSGTVKLQLTAEGLVQTTI